MLTPERIAELRRLCEAAVQIPWAKGYFVSREGRVFSATGWRGLPLRELAPIPNGKGYLKVRLVVGGRRISVPVHRLVAEAFVGTRPSPFHEVRHLDGNRLNNAASNLAWGTRRDNATDRDRHGRTARGSRNGWSRLTESDVHEIRQRLAAGETQRRIAASFGVCQRTISKISRKEAWRHAG